MDYSTWLCSSTSLSLSSTTNCNTLSLFEESPVHAIRNSTIKTEDVQIGSNEAGALMEQLKKANTENKRLTEMLNDVRENYNELKRQLMVYMSKSASSELANNVSKKRKVEMSINSNNNDKIVQNNNVETSSSDEEDSCEKLKEEVLKTKVTRVAIRTEASDSTLILKDGYQWRKYGQKVTRDNPCPRAYFKCSFAPTCPVKKKVQRSLEDQSVLVATYEGEHNHAPPSQEATSGPNRAFNLGSVPCSTPLGSSGGPTVNLDLSKPKSNTSNEAQKPIINNTNNPTQIFKLNSPEFQKLIAEQMASSLTKDPNFTAALANAMSGRFTRQSSSDS